MPVHARVTSRSVWFWAILLTLLLHVVGLTLLQIIKPFAARTVQPRAPQPIEMVFAQPRPLAPPEATQPNEFTELPPDRADVRANDPDFLSNLDSRAQDQAEDGEAEAAPRMQGESEAPHVAMTESEQVEVQEALELTQEGLSSQPRELEEPSVSEPEPVDPFAPQVVTDFSQLEMFRPAGNVALDGDLSLNTIAWDYAPWLQRFTRDFHQHWVAPYAYHLGVIHGWSFVEVVVSPDGKLHQLTLLDEEGHESLGLNSLASFRATAPFRPLPAHFPEDFLVMHWKLIYPDRKRR